jgi:hypothetical protein
MRVETIEDITTLEPGQRRLLEDGIANGCFDEDAPRSSSCTE